MRLRKSLTVHNISIREVDLLLDALPRLSYTGKGRLIEVQARSEAEFVHIQTYLGVLRSKKVRRFPPLEVQA